MCYIFYGSEFSMSLISIFLSKEQIVLELLEIGSATSNLLMVVGNCWLALSVAWWCHRAERVLHLTSSNFQSGILFLPPHLHSLLGTFLFSLADILERVGVVPVILERNYLECLELSACCFPRTFLYWRGAFWMFLCLPHSGKGPELAK